MELLLVVLFAVHLGLAEPPASWAERYNIDPDARLHHLASSRDYEALKIHLGQPGVDVSAGAQSSHPLFSGMTPLMLAAVEGWSDGVNLLLEHGADPAMATESGLEVLHFAARRDCAACIKSLIEHGARVNATDEYGFMPLHEAAHHSTYDIVRLLVEHGAEVDENSVCSAAMNDEHGPRMLRLLLGFDPAMGEGCFGNPELSGPLALAIYYDVTDAALELIRLLPPDALDVVNDEGDSAFLTAAGEVFLSDQCEIMAALLERGVNATRVNKQGENALHRAAMNPNSCECFWEIVRIVGEVDQRDVEGRTPLMRARGFGSVFKPDCAVEAFVGSGADVNARDNSGDTALHIAIRENRPTTAEALIRFGADINAPGHEGTLPIEIVEERLRRRQHWQWEEWNELWEFMRARLGSEQ